MDGVKMESNNYLNFLDKSSIIPIFDEFHDRNCTFKIIDDYKLEILIEYENKKYKKLSIIFIDKVLDSFTIYNFENNKGKFIGEIIDNNQTEVLESLHVELIDCLFSNSDLILLSVDSTDNNYGNRIVVKLADILSIEFY